MAKWYPLSEIASEIPDLYRPWFSDPYSMTAGLRRVGGSIEVEVLRQADQHPDLDEAEYLGLHPKDHVLVREVYLRHCDVTWVYARSLIPNALLTGPYRSLCTPLDDRPLGELLFRQPGVYRQKIEIACLDRSQREFSYAIQGHPYLGEQLWARRSLFYVFETCISVSEIIFPEIPDYVSA
jgi:chorismate lyase